MLEQPETSEVVPETVEGEEALEEIVTVEEVERGKRKIVKKLKKPKKIIEPSPETPSETPLD